MATNRNESKMRVALAMFTRPDIERLQFAKQLGVDDIILWGNTFRRPPAEGVKRGISDTELSFDELLELRTMIENQGLRLYGIENLPQHFYDKIFWGTSGRDEQLEHYVNTIRNMARAGIFNLGYNWIPYGVKRTSYAYPIRGGALATAYHHADMENAPLYFGRRYSEDEFWENYSFFINGILPTVEECGVTVSCHPNDPPVNEIGGIPHLLRGVEGYLKAFSIHPSENHKVTLCLGNFEEMGGDLIEKIRTLGTMDKIHYVHFQSVRGSVPDFNEEFIDTGDHDPYDIIMALREVGFSGVMIPGHVPQIAGDTEWRTTESDKYTPYHHPMGGYRARAYTIGYLKGLIKATERMNIREQR